jgi:hypothetical protein
MSAESGIDFLDKDLKKYLSYSRRKREDSEDASALGFIFERFALSGQFELVMILSTRHTLKISILGTRNWREPTVEWLLSYILTELAVTPHTVRQGRNAKSITSAYQSVVEQLKMRRYEEFQRGASVGLVKEYLTCTDELTSICDVSRTHALLRYLQVPI